MPMHARSLLRILWTRFTWRHWCLAPLQSALLVGILSLGIAVFFAIRLANQAAVASFQNFTDLITAESDGLITARAGSLPESVLGELRAALSDDPVNFIPVVETTAARPRTHDDEAIGSRETFQLLGVDLVAVQNIARQRPLKRTWFRQRAELPRARTPTDTPASKSEGIVTIPSDIAFWQFFFDPHAVFISDALAQRERLTVGGELPLLVNERLILLHVVGLIPTDPAKPQAPLHLLVMDLPALQQLTGKAGKLDRIEFVLEPGAGRAARSTALRMRLQALATGTDPESPRWLVCSPADRRESAALMTQAFRLNLSLLSLLALLVGLYLVFQALDGAVVRRREEIAILRSLGVEPRTLLQAWLLEAAALGLVGGLLGLLLGWLGAQGAVRIVGRTVNALYYATSADAASLDLGEALLALVLAIAASLLAGWLPARTAATTPPAQMLVRGGSTTYAGGKLLRKTWLGFLLLVSGAALSTLSPLHLRGGGRLSIAAYVAALCWVLGSGILGGAVLRGIAWLAERLGGERTLLRLAVSQLRAPSGRHRLAVAGLVCAVAMTAGMAILVGSFDTTIRGWIERTFQADLYLSSDGAQSASTENRISPATWRAVITNNAVARANVMQVVDIRLRVAHPSSPSDNDSATTLLVGSDLDFFRRYSRPAWREEPRDDDVFNPERNSGLGLVSESFGDRFRVGRGDHLSVPTPTGPRDVTIAGVFSDYGNERGSLVIERRQFAAWFGDDLATSLILVLKPGRDTEAVRSELRAAHPGLGVFTNAYLRGEALRIFRQTFAITYALELIGVAVAVAGVGFTMVSLLLERRTELTTLRALGLRRSELAAAAAWEGALTALGGVTVGLVASLGLGWLLIHRVNKQTFGWTLETDRPWSQLLALGTLVIAAATATAWAAGRWGAQLPTEREE